MGDRNPFRPLCIHPVRKTRYPYKAGESVGPPGPEPGRFVEVENQHGRSVNVGEWFIGMMAFGPFVLAHPISPSWRAIRRMAINNTASDLAVELQKIHDSEINIRISWFWDGGIDIPLGDDMNGYLAEETLRLLPRLFPGCRRRLLISTRDRPTRSRSARN
jgi:hypothetical protein